MNQENFLFFHVGTMQMLDARHIELFLSEGFQNRSWEYELIGSHKIEKDVRAASAGIFDLNHFKDCQSAGKSSFYTLCSSCSVRITKKDSQYAHYSQQDKPVKVKSASASVGTLSPRFSYERFNNIFKSIKEYKLEETENHLVECLIYSQTCYQRWSKNVSETYTFHWHIFSNSQYSYFKLSSINNANPIEWKINAVKEIWFYKTLTVSFSLHLRCSYT